ncbi:M20 family metallopeptidase [Calycomorphotria hydatis]|uniref:Succinyl-diaminopimelate desuccinylase n=1 Tax=Calycomorphotria hydatis TaxID=2528027 RepID=A0A517TDP9_9PLAN|nr:M20/M25/M40 family metallo-hydrolase [Calycomorphotria hydatis]QDT66492.1 Succinyl-diaminopimelate desuccinylase [Calycomorphotria hydatis]
MNNDEELRSRLTALTRDLVLIPSTESRPTERERCFEFLQNHVESISGVRTEFFESREHRSMVVRPTGIDAPEILLCGHIDVIEHSHPDCYHSKIEHGRICGPGTGDMKGQIAILIELYRAFQIAHPGLSLGMALTSDEERGGYDGVRYLVDDVGLRCGIAIIPDGGSLADITVEEKGVLHAKITRKGREAHAARPWLGENALEELLLSLAKLKTHFDSYWPTEPIEEQVNHWFPTCSITICATENTTTNRIPDEATAVIDIRFPPPHTVESIIAEVRQQLGPECHLQPEMTAEPTHLDPDILFCEATANVADKCVHMVRASGGSDARFFRRYGIPVNLSRPLVGNLHAIDEWIDIESMVQYYRICEQYIERKLKLPKEGTEYDAGI